MFNHAFQDRTVWLSGHTGFMGVYPGLTPAMLEYMVATIRRFVQTAAA